MELGFKNVDVSALVSPLPGTEVPQVAGIYWALLYAPLFPDLTISQQWATLILDVDMLSGISGVDCILRSIN